MGTQRGKCWNDKRGSWGKRECRVLKGAGSQSVVSVNILQRVSISKAIIMWQQSSAKLLSCVYLSWVCSTLALVYLCMCLGLGMLLMYSSGDSCWGCIEPEGGGGGKRVKASKIKRPILGPQFPQSWVYTWYLPSKSKSGAWAILLLNHQVQLLFSDWISDTGGFHLIRTCLLQIPCSFKKSWIIYSYPSCVKPDA